MTWFDVVMVRGGFYGLELNGWQMGVLLESSYRVGVAGIELGIELESVAVIQLFSQFVAKLDISFHFPLGSDLLELKVLHTRLKS
jgi:hypothetical protein